MRPGQQQNRRGRGRNNGRKGQSSLSRNLESNGPDVKIRGTAAHIAEKYMALARDAMSSGDQVMSENYLQHAEHYNRIIMAAQAQYQEQTGQRMPSDQSVGGESGHGDAGYDGDDDGYEDQSFADHQGQPRQNELRQHEMPRGFEPQPMMPRQPGNDARPYEGRQGGDNRFASEPRQGNGQGEGRQQGEFRNRRNRHRQDNRFRQHQGGAIPANPADIAAMAAANGSSFSEGERRRPHPPQEPGPSSDGSED